MKKNILALAMLAVLIPAAAWAGERSNTATSGSGSTARATSNATAVGGPFFPGILPNEVFVGNFTAAEFALLPYATKRFAGAEKVCRTIGYGNEPTGSRYHPVYISREENSRPLKTK